MALDGVYAEMYRSQAGWYSDAAKAGLETEVAVHA